MRNITSPQGFLLIEIMISLVIMVSFATVIIMYNHYHVQQYHNQAKNLQALYMTQDALERALYGGEPTVSVQKSGITVISSLEKISPLASYTMNTTRGVMMVPCDRTSVRATWCTCQGTQAHYTLSSCKGECVYE